MPYIPFLYFIALAAYFYHKQRCWSMDIAATSLLIVISFFSIMIDINDVYGSYGINHDNMTLPTIMLYCLQWTIMLLPIHVLSNIPLEKHFNIKEPLLYMIFFLIVASSLIMIATSIEDIRNALILDMAEVYNDHIKNISSAKSNMSNYLMFIPQILVASPFPTLAMFFWFYMKTSMKCSKFLEAGMLIASIAQAILAIIIAGRAAFIFWGFDFFMLFSYFYRYMSIAIKRKFLISALVLFGLIGSLFISITISRFDDVKNDSDPFISFYGYAGQHVNNFCTMFVKGQDSPLQISREFPLIGKLTGQEFDLIEHYNNTSTRVDAAVNVFDTFGAEVYLDLGWFGYTILLLIILVITYMVKLYWKELEFHNIFLLVILIAFFTRGLFSWPFTGHYTTLAIITTLGFRYMFKYLFKI